MKLTKLSYQILLNHYHQQRSGIYSFIFVTFMMRIVRLTLFTIEFIYELTLKPENPNIRCVRLILLV